jgi:hypothetical protein
VILFDEEFAEQLTKEKIGQRGMMNGGENSRKMLESVKMKT